MNPTKRRADLLSLAMATDRGLDLQAGIDLGRIGPHMPSCDSLDLSDTPQRVLTHQRGSHRLLSASAGRPRKPARARLRVSVKAASTQVEIH